MSEQESNAYRAQRVANMEALQARGYAPYGQAFERTGTLQDLRDGFADERHVSAAGRLSTLRDMGKSLFADLRDGTGRLQIYIKKNVVGDDAFAAFKLLDLGDHVGIEGDCFTTRTGEPTVQVQQWTLLAKALRPPPEKWHGLKDVEARYRQRYLDLMANPEACGHFRRRAALIREIRAFLCERGFMEVETPMLQAQPGGAAAKPFATHYDALASDMVLRIAPELYLKRLLVGGYDRVFELNRNFRNEGLSRTHNPEFTMLEIYEAYSDVSGMRALIQDLITTAARKVFGTLVVGEGDNQVDLTPPWREATYRDLVLEAMGSDWYDLPVAQAREKACAQGLDVDPDWDHAAITHEVYEKLIEHTLIQPTFVMRMPAALIPLARACPDDPSVVDVFELVIRGQEVAPAYTEMNDPILQRRRFVEQAAGQAEKLDEDFITALEYGMPPAGGMGVGVDRLMMILSGAEAIRDVILFPQLRQRG